MFLSVQLRDLPPDNTGFSVIYSFICVHFFAVFNMVHVFSVAGYNG